MAAIIYFFEEQKTKYLFTITTDWRMQREIFGVKKFRYNQTSFASTDVEIYTIFCYVPKNKYSELEGYVMQIKEIMKDIYPQFIPTGNQTPSFYDDDLKAHMVSIDYKNYKKI